MLFCAMKINLYFPHTGLSRLQGRQGNSINNFFSKQTMSSAYAFFSFLSDKKKTNKKHATQLGLTGTWKKSGC